jgi:flagellar motor protein MotB
MSDNRAYAATGEGDASVTATARSLLDQLTLARATELARAGRYAEAEEILSTGGDETDYAPAALDLLARMRAQQGHFAEAEKLWTRAAKLEPSNAAYPSALRRAAAASQQRSRRLAILIPLVACVIAGASVWMWWQHSKNARRAQSYPTQPAPASSTPGQQAAAPQPPAAPSDSEQSAVPPIGKEINVRGVTQMNMSGVLLVSFDDGLFDRGLRIKPDARERLKELGRQLKPYAATSAIEIVGMTDDLPVPRNSRYTDNASLEMERARAVYDFLRFTSGLEAQSFSIGSNGQRQKPSPNDTPANRARNRTVVLRISTR